MFGKNKKNAQSPIEEMEQFYLNQFLNSPKTPPQGVNRMQFPNNLGPGLPGSQGFGGMGNQPQFNNFQPNQMPFNTQSQNMFPSSQSFNNQPQNMFPGNQSFNNQPQNMFPTNQSFNSQPQNPFLNNQSFNNPTQNTFSSNESQIDRSSNSFPGKYNELTSLIQPTLDELGHEPSTLNLRPATSQPQAPVQNYNQSQPQAPAQNYNQPQPQAPAQNYYQSQSQTPIQSYEPVDDYRDEVDEIYNRVDNINIRLRKVESYLGFRPDNTI
ncbi:hypothetical protein GMA32_10775 [Turicibacter sanguinis]|nr:hypothetical protein [Turicibacter sanguinis]MTM13832.1 hypothetical protein [Turicibacter sanguinis]